jgi:hypothetical protein
MKRVILASVLTLAWGTLPAFAASSSATDAQLKPLRTLTYALEMTIGNVREMHVDAIGSAGSGVSNAGAALESKGTINVDVIAVTADGGLVVDVSENASNRSHAKVRVAIAKDGAISYDPKQQENVTVEEFALLGWLSRGFYAAPPDPPGTAWDTDVGGQGVTGKNHYRVLSVNGDTVTLDCKTEERKGGADSFDMTRIGTVVYDMKMVAPRSASYQEVNHSQRLGHYDTTTVSVSLKLANDTFGKKP